MTLIVDTLRRQLQNNPNLNKRKRAVIGDNNGRIHAGDGFVFVRLPITVDPTTGNKIDSPAMRVRINPGATFPVYVGSPVYVGLDDDGELALIGSTHAGLRQAGINPALSNPLEPATKNLPNLDSVGYLRSYAIATENTASMNVSVMALIYRNPVGDWQVFGGGTVDLSSHLPASANEKQLALVYLDTTDNTLNVVTSTAKDAALDFTLDDDEEVVNALPAGAMPSAIWIVKNGDTTIKANRKRRDMRQWINNAPTQSLHTAAPTANDDIDDGYTVGHMWLDTTNDKAWVCLDNTSTAAVWEQSAGTFDSLDIDGRMRAESITIDGDTGGIAGTVTITDDTSGTPTDSSTVTEWIKIYIGTSVRYIPAYT